MIRLLVRVLLVGAGMSCGSSPPPPATPLSNTAAPASGPAPRTLAGTYVAEHSTMVVCEDGRGLACEETGEDRLVITTTGPGKIGVSLETLGTNFHTCSFEGELTRVEGPAPGERYQYVAAGTDDFEACELTLIATDRDITVIANSCRDFCGARASLDSSFARP